MKRFAVAIIAILILSMALPSVALAQGNSNLQVLPGGEAKGVIYFYNVDGSRTTHITLERVVKTQDNAEEFPDNWEVEIAPPLHDQQYDIGGGNIITVTENLYAEPTERLQEKAEDVPGENECLPLPNNGGYALAKPATITISVPESEKIGTSGSIRILATGSCLGQTGDVSTKLAGDFDFTITTVSELTNEQPITPGEGFDIGRWLPVIIAVVIVILAGVLIPRFVIRRRER